MEVIVNRIPRALGNLLVIPQALGNMHHAGIQGVIQRCLDANRAGVALGGIGNRAVTHTHRIAVIVGGLRVNDSFIQPRSYRKRLHHRARLKRHHRGTVHKR